MASWTGQSSSAPDMLDRMASLFANELYAYAVARAVRLALYHIVLRGPASHQVLAHVAQKGTAPHTMTSRGIAIAGLHGRA